MVSGVFPDLLKLAIVRPIYKNGVRSDFQNYRSISVLPSFLIIFEKVVFNRLLHFLDTNNILCNNQYGFRSNHSTFMPLIDMYERVSAAIDNKEYSIRVFIDLSKAFDSLLQYFVKKIRILWYPWSSS